MGVKEVFTKLRCFLNQQHAQHEKITPNEMELRSFKKREYLDNVKKELGKYRLQASDEALRGTKISSSAPILTTPPYGQKKQKNNLKPVKILDVEDVFFKKSRF